MKEDQNLLTLNRLERIKAKKNANVVSSTLINTKLIHDIQRLVALILSLFRLKKNQISFTALDPWTYSNKCISSEKN